MKSPSSAEARRTPRSWSTASAGCATCCRSRSWSWSTPTADRLELVGAFGRRILDRHGPSRHVDHHDRRWRRRWTASTPCSCSCGSAARPPATRTRPGRWSAAASARRPPAPAASPRRCARSRSCSTSPSRCAARGTGRVDHRLHQPGRHRHPGPAAGRPPRRRAVQRRHRLPASVRRLPRGRARPGTARPRRAEPPHLGASGPRATASTGCRSCSPDTWTTWRRTSSCRRAC